MTSNTKLSHMVIHRCAHVQEKLYVLLPRRKKTWLTSPHVEEERVHRRHGVSSMTHPPHLISPTEGAKSCTGHSLAACRPFALR